MSVLDIIIGALLAFAIYKGIKNGLFVELASFVSLIIGIFVAIKFSYLVKSILEKNVSWQPKYIELTAFILTFIIVVVGIHLLAKFFTSIADWAYLGWLNTVGGAAFSIIKTVLALSVLFTIFQKINVNHFIIKEETLNNSIFYNPIENVSKFIYPRLEELYQEFKEKTKDSSLKSDNENDNQSN
jgi:membrane protein required for colicin V production